MQIQLMVGVVIISVRKMQTSWKWCIIHQGALEKTVMT